MKYLNDTKNGTSDENKKKCAVSVIQKLIITKNVQMISSIFVVQMSCLIFALVGLESFEMVSLIQKG